MWWVPCHHVIACPHVADESGDLQMLTLAANVLNRQSRTADKRRSFGMGIEWGPKNSLTMLMKCYTDIQTSNNGGLV
jgi:hypothetical protein